MKKNKKYPNAINNWPVDDRPREKLLKFGEQTLSNAELLGILIRTGSPGKSAVDIAREILNKFKRLRDMTGVDIAEFKKISGLKDAKIEHIKAEIELGKRLIIEEKAFSISIKSSKNVADYLMPLMRDLKNETFQLLLLDKRNCIIDTKKMSNGNIDNVRPSIRDILVFALNYKASAIIVAHNHPSGNVEPSNADKDLTKNIILSATAMELRLFDHIIIGENKYFSFADEGLIEEYEMQTVANL